MIRSSKTFERPSTSVVWYQATEEFNTYARETYGVTGKRVSITKVNGGADDLTITFVDVWKDRADYEVFVADPIVSANRARRDAYYAEHGVTIHKAVVETI